MRELFELNSEEDERGPAVSAGDNWGTEFICALVGVDRDLQQGAY